MEKHVSVDVVADVQPTPTDFGLDDQTLAREIRKDTLCAWYFENGRLTPGTGAGLLSLAIMIALGRIVPASDGIMLYCLALPTAIIVGGITNSLVRKWLKHDGRYTAYSRALFGYRFLRSEVDRRGLQSLGQISRPWRTGGVFRRDDNHQTKPPQPLAA